MNSVFYFLIVGGKPSVWSVDFERGLHAAALSVSPDAKVCCMSCLCVDLVLNCYIL
jgi:hypothetical protein